MQLPFFYEENITTGNFTLSAETSKHCILVLRMQAGEQLQLTNGKGNLYTATIINADKKASVVNVSDPVFTQPLKQKITIAISLLKTATRFEWFLEKATEIGVSAIIPLNCKRTEKHHFRYDRMQNILISAMLQSRQTYLPLLHEVSNYTSLISSTQHKQKLIAHCTDNQKTSINKIKKEADILMLIGPEGDFTNEEITLALQHDFIPVTLGDTRLRTETAGIVAATLLVNID